MENIGNLFGPRALLACVVLWMAERGLKQSNEVKRAEWRERWWEAEGGEERKRCTWEDLIKKGSGHLIPVWGQWEDVGKGTSADQPLASAHPCLLSQWSVRALPPRVDALGWLGTIPWSLTRLWQKTPHSISSLSQQMEAFSLQQSWFYCLLPPNW